jgi:HSP20 family protein
MIQRYTPTMTRWDPFAEMAQLHKAMNRLFGTPNGAAEAFPPVNLYASENEAVVSAELPGVDPDKLEISVNANTFTLSGSRESEKVDENASYHRQERFAGRFSRTLELPFNVDAERVNAQLRHGLLKVTLPRAEADKPKKITIESK